MAENMSTHEKNTFTATYDWASKWEDLPWSHSEPTLFLSEVCRRREPATALDIGCGGGTDSLFLASQGWDVTALDFIDKALEYTQQRAKDAGLSLTTVEADITTWEPPQQYDLILDHGLLHNMDPERHDAYREVLLKALAPGGEFILLHWHPAYEGQQNGKMGPTRVGRADIKRFFAPELQERYFAREEFEDLTSLVGGAMVQAYYWFRHNKSWLQPAELIAQIEATLARHSVEVTDVSGAVSDELLAIIFGPGRFGYRYDLPEVAEVKDLIAELAERAGKDTDYVGNLLQVFASADHSNICITDARCDVCEVSFCKRLRYR
ncbi:MAG: class I SAM-dependent methyltransferase [Gammaproteobacteria bacterium]